MASQAEVINEINIRSDKAAAAGCPKRSAALFALRLVTLPSLAFVRSFLAGGGPFGGMEAFRQAVNNWAVEFVSEAKCYESAHADKEKSIIESRDFG